MPPVWPWYVLILCDMYTLSVGWFGDVYLYRYPYAGLCLRSSLSCGCTSEATLYAYSGVMYCAKHDKSVHLFAICAHHERKRLVIGK